MDNVRGAMARSLILQYHGIDFRESASINQSISPCLYWGLVTNQMLETRLVPSPKCSKGMILPLQSFNQESSIRVRLFPSQTNPPARPFRKLENPADLRKGDTVFLNTPVNGLCEGTLVTTAWTPVEGENGFEHLDSSEFTYFGNGSSETFFDACCGAVLWDDNFNALGQLRYQNTERQSDLRAHI
jgi:hypothetical protein